MTFEKKNTNNTFFDVNPGDLFKDFGRQIFDQFPGTDSMKSDIKELKNAYIVEAELPGIKKENISLAFENNLLSIEGKQIVEVEENDDTVRKVHQERNHSDLNRQFPFENVDEDGIKATFENGLLTVTLPKKEQTKQTKSNITID
ncbi:MAG TPA: Hsp20/alpha crystallin family protein [Staphylococcus sp.]|nr:Hsp20/alpha crystallin family protein [Staphylococcus sp.]